MKRRTLLGAVGGVTLLGGGYLGWELFAPERATVVDEDRVAGKSDDQPQESMNDTTTTGDGGSEAVVRRS
ncbi:hypothetical protein [Halorubellus litoreus]|uniref:Uncharacterized protein n=1 Tax=Halorubellus litoreus TaxID=755308 RepID=A0ABD5VK09_9EURY